MNETREVNKKAPGLIDRWQDAQESVKTAKSILGSAECEVRNAVNAVGRCLDPGDMKDNEEFGIWVRNTDRKLEGIVMVKRVREGTYEISWRKKR